MSVDVYVWSPKFGSISNYIAYQLGAEELVKEYLNGTLSTGHVSVQIKDDESGESLYVSHRANPDDGEGVSSDIKGQRADLRKIEYKNDFDKRGEPKKFELKCLNAKAMIQYYKEEIVTNGEFYTYHGVANNCSKVAYKLIRKGLECETKDEDLSSLGLGDNACLFCRPHQYSTRNIAVSALKEGFKADSERDERRESKIERNLVELRRERLHKEANLDKFIHANKHMWKTKSEANIAIEEFLVSYLKKLDPKDRRKLTGDSFAISLPSDSTELGDIITDIKDLAKSGANPLHILGYLDQKISQMWTPSTIANFAKNIETKKIPTCYCKIDSSERHKFNPEDEIFSFSNRVKGALFLTGITVAGAKYLYDKIKKE